MSLISKQIKELREWASLNEEEGYPDFTAYLLNRAADTIEVLSEKAKCGWISVDKQLPEVEKEVQICAVRKLSNGKPQTIITNAMYEDGTVKENDSIWAWFDLDNYRNEEEDCSIIPEGWWEYTHYLSPFYVEGSNLIDDKVIAWRPLFTGLSVDALAERVLDVLDDQSEESSKDTPPMTKINRIKNLRNYNREYLSDHRYLIDRHEVLKILEDNSECM